MSTLVRSSTATLSRRSSVNSYKPLDHHHRLGEARTGYGRPWRAFSKRNKLEHSNSYPSRNIIVNSRSYRNYRAKQRQIFLKSYTLATAEKLERRRKAESRRLQSLAVKAVVSVMSFLRAASGRLRSCDCRLAVRASSPTRQIHKM